ncbi:methyl-accepting chemotaxis protein [Flocculibacter collagenilyticus]|uniref:methyl-accepting chemotaxis protein n=1 Tax=Flocculibacter collagenilyticus TaxID=2744479 RepID=UPI0018F6AF84|nr:methyl-accepting chemotaxis protein [Flocculibacter collagenilyticus]
MKHFFSALSLKWKLQIGFMAIAMITTIYNRWIASNELQQMIATAKQSNLPTAFIQTLEQQYTHFVQYAVFDALIQFTLQFIVIAVIARLFVEPIIELIESLKAVEAGDLTQGVKVHSKDEFGELESHFNVMLNQLSRILSSVEKSSIHMSQSAFQIAEVSHEIENISQSEQAKSNEVISATSQLHESAQSVLSYAEQTAEKAKETVDKSQQGKESLSQSIAQMDQISSNIQLTSGQINELVESTATINEILSAIKQIAEQTNLLALNAAIEAARAGDQGRGFAVVADEVRQLSIRTHQSAEQVSDIVSSLTTKVDGAEKSMNALVEQVSNSRTQIYHTEDIINTMQHDVSQTASLNEQITGACDDQMSTFATLQQSHTSLFNTLKENSAKVANTASISDSLFELTENLKNQMAGLKFINQEEDEDKDFEDTNQRRAKRVKSHKLVTVEVNGNKYEGLSQDLSDSGIRILVQGHVPENAEVIIGIKPPSNNLQEYRKQQALQIKARAAWQNETDDNKTLAGFMFLDLTEAQKKGLADCIAFFSAQS